MNNYKNQNQEIQELLKSIGSKCSQFAETNTNPNYQDLLKVTIDLKEIDQFIN